MDLSADLYPQRGRTLPGYSQQLGSPALYSRRLPLLPETDKPLCAVKPLESMLPPTATASSTVGSAIFQQSWRHLGVWQRYSPGTASALYGTLLR